MRIIRSFLLFISFVSLLAIIFKNNLVLDAPHPGVGSTTLDFTSIYGVVGESVILMYPLILAVFVISIVGSVLTTISLALKKQRKKLN
ncbi:hypothetical protein [Terribacillus halophilus]|uniref:hypothetical protein n=1 Tax=Terribacillus halophilus TaxID=361279 RepID=UPI003981AD97